MSFLDKAAQFVNQQISQTHASSVLGIDIGTSSIKVVQLRNEGGTALLETYGEIALGPFGDTAVGESVHLEPTQMAKALKKLLDGADVTATACGVSIPFASSLIKLIEVPALDEKKLATVIPIEARKYIPVSTAEVQLDWYVVPETEQRLFEGTSEVDDTDVEPEPLQKRMVLIVAMHNTLLDAHAETLQLTGITPHFFEIEAFSNIRATVDRGLAPVALIDIGAATTKLYVVELGIILASHVVQKGAQDITRTLTKSVHVSPAKAEELKRQVGISADVHEGDYSHVSHAATLTMEQIFTEVRRVLVGFQRRYGKAITKVVLTGGGANLNGLTDFARQQLELEVEVAQPFKHVQAPAFLSTVLEEASPDFAVAAGLALRALHELSG